jgi:hypothetical protein
MAVKAAQNEQYVVNPEATTHTRQKLLYGTL